MLDCLKPPGKHDVGSQEAAGNWSTGEKDRSAFCLPKKKKRCLSKKINKSIVIKEWGREISGKIGKQSKL